MVRLILLLILPLAFACATGCSETIDAIFGGSVSVDPSSLKFVAVEGATTGIQQVAFDCEDYNSDLGTNVSCGASIKVATVDGKDWLRVNKDSYDGREIVEVNTDTTGLTPGTYTGTITTEVDFCAVCETADVQVELTITAGSS